MKLRALLDANVLYPATLRSLLIDLAVADLYMAFWTNEIHDEWIRNLASHRPELDRAKLERTRALMDRALETAQLTDVPPLATAITLPDEDDRHVLAAALHAGADVIVTQNLRDFPARVLEPLGLQAVAPEAFLLELLGASPQQFTGAVRAGRLRLRAPPFTAQAYMAMVRTVLTKSRGGPKNGSPVG
ncbi:putative toxin-antitoxin system toxin component, PIN family [Deinococcus marmoris]|uniref:PIN domain-containing protein n=1 Tax=Deinococcus marmoris TaxID=249408 RepID=UPI00068DCE07|nr:PIN domain-containing protein [Deinococcus marmoris]